MTSTIARAAQGATAPSKEKDQHGDRPLCGQPGCAPAAESPLSEERAARYAVVLKALADPHRLRILALLAAQPAAEPLCVCDVESAFDLSQPTISHHLRVLREAGLIGVTKRGLWHYYALVRDGVQPIQHLLADFAGG